MNMVTQEELKSKLQYDPDTGALVWLPRPGDSHLVKLWNNRYAGKRAGYTEPRGYVHIPLMGGRYTAHRLVWLYVHGEFPADEIDHINGNAADNRIKNLRLATRRQNARNTKLRKHSQSGLKGVQKTKSGKWTAKISFSGKQIYLGTFNTSEQAHQAFCDAAKRHYGEYAREK